VNGFRPPEEAQSPEQAGGPGSAGIRASDADRDEAAETLAEAVSAGRLPVEELDARLDALYAAVSTDQVRAVVGDLPARPAGRGAFYHAFDPYRCIVIGGRGQRAGQFRLGQFCLVVAVFGGIDMDLRTAQLAADGTTITIWSLAARVAIQAPARSPVRDQVLALGPRYGIRDTGGGSAGPPLHLRGACVGGSFRVSRA